jgi:hypothetical protein
VVGRRTDASRMEWIVKLRARMGFAGCCRSGQNESLPVETCGRGPVHQIVTLARRSPVRLLAPEFAGRGGHLFTNYNRVYRLYRKWVCVCGAKGASTGVCLRPLWQCRAGIRVALDLVHNIRCRRRDPGAEHR